MALWTILKSAEYSDWQWELASIIRREIEGVLATANDEIACVQKMVDVIVKKPPFSQGRSEVSVDAAFLHGAKSQVKFNVGEKEHQCELADMLLLSVYKQGQNLMWGRACFIQTKLAERSTSRSAMRYSKIKEDQITLLRSFPEFTGYSGVFKGQKHKLRNQSGMLGAYGLLSPPGELAVLSARILHHLLGGRQSFTGKEILPLGIHSQPCQLPIFSHTWPFDSSCSECNDLLHYFWHHQHRSSHNPIDSYIPLPSVLVSVGLDSVVEAWSSLRLGEAWFPASKSHAQIALGECIKSAVYKVGEATDKLGDVRKILGRPTADIVLGDDGDGRGFAVITLIVSEEPEGK